MMEILHKRLEGEKKRKTLLEGLSTVAETEDKLGAEDVLDVLGEMSDKFIKDLRNIVAFYRMRINNLTDFLESLG